MADRPRSSSTTHTTPGRTRNDRGRTIRRREGSTRRSIRRSRSGNRRRRSATGSVSRSLSVPFSSFPPPAERLSLETLKEKTKYNKRAEQLKISTLLAQLVSVIKEQKDTKKENTKYVSNLEDLERYLTRLSENPNYKIKDISKSPIEYYTEIQKLLEKKRQLENWSDTKLDKKIKSFFDAYIELLRLKASITTVLYGQYSTARSFTPARAASVRYIANVSRITPKELLYSFLTKALTEQVSLANGSYEERVASDFLGALVPVLDDPFFTEFESNFEDKTLTAEERIQLENILYDGAVQKLDIGPPDDPKRQESTFSFENRQFQIHPNIARAIVDDDQILDYSLDELPLFFIVADEGRTGNPGHINCIFLIDNKVYTFGFGYGSDASPFFTRLGTHIGAKGAVYSPDSVNQIFGMSREGVRKYRLVDFGILRNTHLEKLQTFIRLDVPKSCHIFLSTDARSHWTSLASTTILIKDLYYSNAKKNVDTYNPLLRCDTANCVTFMENIFSERITCESSFFSLNVRSMAGLRMPKNCRIQKDLASIFREPTSGKSKSVEQIFAEDFYPVFQTKNPLSVFPQLAEFLCYPFLQQSPTHLARGAQSRTNLATGAIVTEGGNRRRTHTRKQRKGKQNT